MADRDQVLECLYRAIEEINDLNEGERRLEPKADTVLFGDEQGFDSINLVRFIVACEDEVNDTFDTDVSLTDDKALSRHKSPFRSVGAFADFVISVLDEAEGG